MQLSAIRFALLQCLQANKALNLKIFNGFSESDWSTFCDLARHQRVMSLLYYRFKEEECLDALPLKTGKAFAAKFKAQTLRNLKLQRELCKIAGGLQKLNIRVLALKGMHLSPLIYPHPGLRQMRDLDLLVPLDKASQTSKFLQSSGYQASRNLQESDLDFSTHQHLPLMVKDNIIVEIHGRVCKTDKIYSIDPQILWDNAQETKIGGVTVSFLDPVDLFLHLCIHISYMHMFIRGVRHYYDLVVVLQHYGAEFDWHKLLQRTQERDWERGVLIVLLVTRQLFGIDLPAEVLETLDGCDERSEIEKTTQAAISELWTTHTPESRNFSHNFAALPLKKGWLEKLRYIGQRIFLPPELMMNLYGVKAGTLKAYLYYFVRAKDILRRYNQPLIKIVQGDRLVKATAERKNYLQNWLEGK